MSNFSVTLLSSISNLNSVAEFWAQWMMAMAWQSSILFLLLLGITWLLRHRSARLRYALWMLFFAKLILPPSLALVTGWGWWLLPSDTGQSADAVSTQTIVQSANQESRFAEFPKAMDVGHAEPTELDWETSLSNLDNVTAIPATEVMESISTAAWLMLAWLLVLGVLILRLVLGWFAVQQLRRSVSSDSDEYDILNDRLGECQQRIGNHRRIEVKTGQANCGPMLIGCLRPLIIVPVGITQKLGDDELESVLLHELCHCVRRDAWIQVLQSAVAAAYFFNPLIWVASRIIDRLREDACDESTLAFMNGQGSAYGSGLVKVAELATQAPPSIALGIFESKQQVARRLKRILDPTCPVGRKLSVSSLLSIVAIAAILIPSAAKPTAEVEVSQNAPVERQQEVDDESTDSAEKEELRNYLAAIPEKDRVTVTGLVTDESGEPIAKSSVKLRPNWLGVTLRTNTDADGMYSLSGNRNHMRAAFVEASGSEGELLGASRLPWDASQVGLEPIDVELKSPKIVSSVVLDDNELPVSGATVGFVAGSITHRVAITDAAGKASLKLPQSITISTVFALSDQHGFDYRLFRPGRKSRGDRKQKPAGLPEGPVRLTLGDTGPLTIRILDADGNPIPEVDVYPWLLQKPGENDKFNVSIAGPMSKELFSSKTDMNGEAEFPWLPKWNDRTSFWPTLEGYVRHQQLYDREKHGDHFTFTLQKTVLISGTVKLPDGRVCADSEVIVRGDGRGMNDFQREVRTDSEGRYEIRVDPDMIYLVVAKFKSKDGSQFVSAKRDGFAVWPGKPKENLNLQLEPAARVFGKVTRKSGDGVSNQRIRLVLIATSANEAGIELPDPEEQNFHAAPSYWQYTETDSDGDFEFWVANGQYELIGSTQNSRSKFTVKNRKPIQFDFKMNRPEMGMFKGQVIDAETKKPVGHANINVAYRSYRVNSTRSSAMTDAKGRFEFERSLHPMVLFVTDEGRTKGGMIKVGADDKSTDVKISALSSATGVITSSATGTPVSGLKMHYGHRVEMGNGVFTRRFGGSVTTDENGEFVLKGLVVGKKYSATLRTLKNGRIPLVASFKPTDSTEIQLGEIMMQIPDELEK